MKSKKFWFLIGSIVVIVVGAMAAVCVGVISIPMDAVFEILKARICGQEVPAEWQTYDITVWNLRIPRVLLSLLAGGALSLCGAAFQTIFRNPICDPYILGISSGASLGAAIAIITGLDAYFFGLTGMALVTAILTLILILAIASVGKRKSVETILLSGVAVKFLVSAGITLLMVLHQENLDEIIFWTMGSFAASTWEEILGLTIVFILVGSFLYFYSKELNILQLGTETAQTTGVNTRKMTVSVLIISSILVATAVACCGVIGFIGLIIPHIVRLLFGNKTRTVFTFSILFGAIFCLLADTCARTLAAPAELPVGSITAIVGAPYFIFLLLTHRRLSAR